MNRVIVFTFLSTALIVSSVAENKENPVITKDSLHIQSRSPKVSSEFGYNIQNSEPASSHFRQEQRDSNGVVRGSYGFRNPNGGFRLVQYVADESGFRAHISSNEQGIGKQNPASVSINRFEHQPIVNDHSRIKPPISTTRLQNPGLKRQETRINSPRYELYSPIAPGPNFGTNNNRNVDLPLLEDNIPYRSVSGNQRNQLTSLRNPIDALIRTRLGIPGEFLSIPHENERGISHPILETSSMSSGIGEQYFRPNHLNEDRTIPRNRIPSDNYLPNNLYPDSLKDNYLRTLSRTSNDFNNPRLNYPQFLTNVPPSSQHKVHTALPDCKSASSAVLCKPPILLSGSFSQQNIRRLPHMAFDENDEVPPSRTFLQDERTSNLDTSSLSSRLLPNLMPNSYSLRSVYKTLSEDNRENKDNERLDPECDKSYHLPDGTSINDFTPPIDQQKYINDAVSDVFTSHNINEHDMPFSNLQQPSSQYNGNKEESEYYSSLVKIMQNDHSLNKLKQLLMKSSQSSTSSTSTQIPKLNMFGILILPSHILKELSNNNVDNSKKTNSFDEKNLSVFGDDIFESDIIDETDKTSKESFNSNPVIHLNENTDFENNGYNFKKENASKNETEVEYGFPVSPSWDDHFQSMQNRSETESPVSKNSEFFVFDDTEMTQKGNNRNKPGEIVDEVSNSSSTDNWRKILEEEISKEYERTSLQQEARFPDIPADVRSASETNSKSNQRQYTLNEHTGPLYDSTGRPIKPENVPIHIHRYVPPAGMTSFPWKFSIPRPAPPRSIVVPPKPLMPS